ncbi:hypothetical protein FGW20_04610 [Methanoculleus sp. FWC-SCC3]|uniref:Pectate lyase superfamily protein domain-containing protein n=1 Tax=Methanoculleus methanifontis TaxID=2584086 RepID=A0ABT8M3B6_9EURY|nr:hypothetical protein [Methanoculleus sp. FWC-SCC3]MDN7012333.1 hypothetical protein [Methanoculleus sp. FWC-SCC3]
MSARLQLGARERRILIAIAIILSVIVAVVLIMHFYPPVPVPPPPPPPPITPIPTTPAVPPEIAGPTIVVAASDSSATAKARADIQCDGTDDQVDIQAAFDELSSGGTVALLDGTFNCAGSIYPGAKTMLRGEGANATFIEFTNNGRLLVPHEFVTLYNFHVRGTGYPKAGADQWLGVVTIYASHAKILGVEGTADASTQAVFLLMHDPDVYTPTLEDIEFVNCKAVDTGTYGFLHNAWGTANRVIRDVRYENCAAINCGRFGAFNPWVTGFDFAELNDIEGLRVTNCLAEGNLESGFHFEWDPEKRDCLLTNCISRNNGQKDYPTKPYREDDRSTHYFGCGYYAPRGDITFINCYSEGNSRHGFYATNGGKLYNCVDRNVGVEKTDYRIVQPASFYAAPTRSIAPSLVLENCSSIDSCGYGLHIDLASDVWIKNFHLENPAGIDGKATNLGGSQGGPLANSVVNIYASGDRAETLIWARNNENVEYSGRIVSDSSKPFVIEGDRTQNVRVKDMEIVSANLAPFTNGVILTNTVPTGAVTFENVAVTSASL